MEQKQINLSALDHLLEELAKKNWAISEEVFTPEFCRDLAHECQKLSERGQLQKASIGHGSSKILDNEIRGDFTLWLDEKSSSSVQQSFLAALEQIRQELNRFFFLGLKRVECHFALYPPKAGYEKHIDNHRGLNHRKITFVLYLNENWQSGDGGELSIYNPENDSEVIAQVIPRLGTLILFRSELFPHQVEKSAAFRMSLTGWFRDDAL
ncbi:MAG: 2OG-Fe(II) oxygenase [Bacillota bacterium]